MRHTIDMPQAIRPGETFDQDRLRRYLQAQLPDLQGDLVVKQFPSGFSNLTYLIQLGDCEMVLRRPPFGANIKSAHDMNREYTILSHLAPIYPKAPQPLLYSDDQSIIGAEFYMMERVRGVILRSGMPAQKVPPAAQMRQISLAFVDALVELHAVDLAAAGLTEFGRAAGYVERQISGWTRRWQQAQTESVPEMDRAATWLAANLPKESGATLIHNDFKYDNVVLNVDAWSEIIAVLDWEMATVGDPLMDLGTTLSYWVQADDPPVMQQLGLSPTQSAGNLTRAELVQQYAEKSGRTVDNIAYYYAYGAFKLGVVVQQIYKRWTLGYTQDARFAALPAAVRACAAIAVNAIEKGTV